jgi:hypothetical protein
MISDTRENDEAKFRSLIEAERLRSSLYVELQ